MKTRGQSMTSRPTSSANGLAGDDSSVNTSIRPNSTGHPQQTFDSSPATEHPVCDGTKTKKNINEHKTLWVTVFKCFQCGKPGHKLPKCTQCSQAYYCNADCQRKNWKSTNPCAGLRWSPWPGARRGSGWRER